MNASQEFDFSAELAAARNMKARTMGWILTIFGAVGFAGSFALTLEKFLKLANPDHVAGCSINIFLDCADAMASAQGAVLGFPNPVIGVAVFPIVATLGVVVIAGGTLPKWIWRSLLVGTTIGAGFIVFLMYTSIHTLARLCPYCMVVWAAMIPLFWYQLVHAIQEGLLPVGDKVKGFVVKNRNLIVPLFYVAVVVWIAIGMGPVISAYLNTK